MTAQKTDVSSKGNAGNCPEVAKIKKKNAADLVLGGLNIRDMVQALTGGRPFVFVIMGFNARFEIFEKIKRIVASQDNLVCIRADDVKCSGHDLLDKIHHLISRAELVIAEVSDVSPNVYYEVGYAVGIQANPMLLFEGDSELPTDLKGLEVIRYRQTREGMQVFEEELRGHIHGRLTSNLSLFRDMLQAPEQHPAYIVASPKYPGADCRITGQVYDGRTFGDQLGILGLLSVFGVLWGERKGVELISAQHAPPDLLAQNYNVYLIGSGKTNPHSAKVMEMLQTGSAVSWHFDPLPGFTRDDPDWPCCLYKEVRSSNKRTVLREPKMGEKIRVGEGKHEIWSEDYGLILRGRHPQYANRLAIVLAGAHSLGTGAACLAATRSELLQKVKQVLPDGAMEDKACAFWVLVKGAINTDGDMLLDPERVTIEEGGVFG